MMKKVLLKLFFTTILICLGSSQVMADVCITDVKAGNEVPWPYANSSVLTGEAIVMDADLSCKEVSDIVTATTAMGLVLEGASLGLACTGFGLPATAALQGGVLVLSAATLYISNLDCDVIVDEAKMKRQIHGAVCDEFAKQGIECKFQPEEIKQLKAEL